MLSGVRAEIMPRERIPRALRAVAKYIKSGQPRWGARTQTTALRVLATSLGTAAIVVRDLTDCSSTQ